MKILDRYVLVSFLKNYLIALMVLIGLYVVLDMVFQFDELAESFNRARGDEAVGTFSVVWAVMDYYFHRSFLIFAQLSGIIPVVAAAFTFIRMSRFNELTAILAAGVSLLRVAAPVIFCGVVINILLLPVTQELIIPAMIPKLTLKHDELQENKTKSFQIRAMQDENNSLLNAGRYTPGNEGKPASMLVVDVIERDADYRPSSHISADSAEYDASQGGWKLTNGLRVTGLAGQKRTRPEAVNFWKSSINPEEIALYRSGDFVDLLPTAKINDLLARPKSYGTTSLMRVKHFRLAQLLMNIILLLLAIPCVLTREPGTLKQASLKAGILTGLCMAVAFIMRQIAGNPPAGEKWVNLWPALMAWVPIFLFLPLAMFLLDRLQTKKT